MNKQFEEWLDNKYGIFLANIYPNMAGLTCFNTLEHSFKWGVYLEFFDSVDLVIEIQTEVGYSEFSRAGDLYLGFVNWDGLDNNGFDTRQEAQKEAIKKAFEILEQNGRKR